MTSPTSPVVECKATEATIPHILEYMEGAQIVCFSVKNRPTLVNIHAAIWPCTRIAEVKRILRRRMVTGDLRLMRGWTVIPSHAPEPDQTFLRVEVQPTDWCWYWSIGPVCVARVDLVKLFEWTMSFYALDTADAVGGLPNRLAVGAPETYVLDPGRDDPPQELGGLRTAIALTGLEDTGVTRAALMVSENRFVDVGHGRRLVRMHPQNARVLVENCHGCTAYRNEVAPPSGGARSTQVVLKDAEWEALGRTAEHGLAPSDRGWI